MRNRIKLIWRLFGSYLLITILALLAIGWLASTFMQRFYLGQTTDDLKARAELLKAQVSAYLDPPQSADIDALCKSAGRLSGTRFTAILRDGTVVGDSREEPRHMDNHAGRPEIVKALAGQTGQSTRYSKTLLQRMMYVAVPVKSSSGVAAVIRAAIPITAIDDALKSLRLKMLFGGIAVAILAAGISLLMSRQYSHPVKEMKQGAIRFAEGDLAHRLPIPDSEEMAGLAEAMNRMAEQLNRRIDTIIRQRNELQTVLTSMLEGVIAVDKDERIVSMNPAAARWFGSERSKVQDRSIPEVVRNLSLQQFITEAVDSSEPRENDITVFQNGERVLNVKSSPLLGADQSQIGALIMFNDVTQLRRLETMRRDFVANVSHEIKTPLTAIKGFVETLQQVNVDDPAESQRFLGIIKKHVDRLSAIIEDLLSLARIEQQDDSLGIHVEPTNLGDVCKSALQIVRAKASEKNIRVVLNCDQQLMADCDPTLMEQAVVNLLDNAIKYSDHGKSIEVSARTENGDAVIEVRDEGIGIAKKHLPRLFERFYRVDKARSRNMGGTGLGLAIVKHIAQVHGGQVTIDSTLGQGSTFVIRLPKT
jgi:two-component system phosphate regulon sensor histidine kinase PhoR